MKFPTGWFVQMVSTRLTLTDIYCYLHETINKPAEKRTCTEKITTYLGCGIDHFKSLSGDKQVYISGGLVLALGNLTKEKPENELFTKRQLEQDTSLGKAL